MKNKKRSYAIVNIILGGIIATIWASILIIYITSNKYLEQIRKETEISRYIAQNEIEIKNKETRKADTSNLKKTTNSKKENVNKQQGKKQETIVEVQETETEAEVEAESKLEDYNNEKNYYNIVQTIGDVDPYYVNIVEEKLLNIPENIMQLFIESGWDIKITTENIAETYFNGEYSSVLAVAIRSKKVILIEDREKAVNNSVEHEIGHFVSAINGEVCLSEEFREIYYEEVETFKNQISDSNCVRDEYEFFAEAFYYLLKDKSKCTPRVTEFIERYM